MEIDVYSYRKIVNAERVGTRIKVAHLLNWYIAYNSILFC